MLMFKQQYWFMAYWTLLQRVLTNVIILIPLFTTELSFVYSCCDLSTSNSKVWFIVYFVIKKIN